MLTTLPPSCAVVMKSGNLNFLEPSGSLQTCNGPALPLPFTNVHVRNTNKHNAVSIKEKFHIHKYKKDYGYNKA